MPIAKIQLPDGRIAKFEVPDGTTPEQVTAFAEQKFAPAASSAQPPKAENTASDSSIVALGAGLGKGFGQVALNAQRYLGKGINAVGNLASPPTDRQEGGNAIGNWLVKDADRGLRNIDAELAPYKHNSPIAATAGEIGGNVVATLPVGGVLAKGVQSVAPGATGLINALTTSGMRAGATPGVANALTRAVGGAATGGASAALVDPESAGTGAAIGAALPMAMRGVGSVGNAIGRAISGPAVDPAVQQAVAAARSAGYVIPPSQAKPTLMNRALEGFSGKITTAQNASARNQPVTNRLASNALGLAEDLPITKEALANIRSAAGKSYDDIAQVGPVISDVPFLKAANDLRSANTKLAKDFPELQNQGINTIADMLNKPRFDSSSIVEALKQLRFDGNANRISLDPATKALGRAQGDAAKALEDLVERNLAKSGNTELLKNFRDGRQLIAKTHTVEKALNDSSGNVSANALARQLEKGKPLSGELKQIASFAAQFPKAAQTVEKMGSLPQVSPLDFGALGTVSALTSNPLLMAGVLARPAARSMVLSAPVQNRLATPAGRNPMMNMLANPTTEQLVYRAAPVVSDR